MEAAAAAAGMAVLCAACWLTAWRITRSKRDDSMRSSMENDGLDGSDIVSRLAMYEE